MAASFIVVNYWTADPNVIEGVPPLGTSTRMAPVASGGSVTVPSTAKWVKVTCDADCRMTFDGVTTPTAGDTPVLAAVENIWSIQPPPLGLKLQFV